jgi:transketolase
MELVSRPHYHNLIRWAGARPEVLVLTADLTSSCEADGFRDAHPDRCFSFGMAEQNLMGFAAGLAREGFFPFVHTFGVFVTRRPYDQVAMSIAYPNLPVRLLGFLPGLTTPGGVTHQAIDDLALMRALPNLTVLECGDATEVESVLDVAQSVPGPVYVRMLRGEVPRLFPASEPLRLGTPRVLRDGNELLVVSSGICTQEAQAAVAAAATRGVGVAHWHCSTIKPLAAAPLAAAIAGVRRGVIVVENHSIIGGLGAAVAEVIAEAGLGRRLVRLGVQDRYAQGASREYLLRQHGLDAMGVVDAIEELLGDGLGITAAELCAGPAGTPAAAGNDVHRVEDL